MPITPSNKTHTTDAAVQSPVDEIVKAGATPPTKQEIAAEAYALYLANGARDGRDLDDWLEAERELTARGQRGVGIERSEPIGEQLDADDSKKRSSLRKTSRFEPSSSSPQV